MADEVTYEPKAFEHLGSLTPEAGAIDVETQDKIRWDSIQRAVEQSKVSTWHNQDGSTTHVSRVITPELYKQYGSPTDPRGGAVWGKMPTPKMPLPSEEDAAEMALQLGDMFVDFYEEAPATANWLMNNPRMLFALPEVASAIDSFYGDYTVVEGVMDFLVADLDVVDYTHWSRAYDQAPATAQFLHDYAGYFNDQQLDVMATVFSGLSQRGQDNLSGLAWRWINRGGGADEGTQDLTDTNTKAEFLKFFYEQGAGQQEWELGEETTLGRIGAFVDAPRRFVWGAASDAWAWASSLGNPEENIYRSALTLGQNIAISQGIDPSESAWRNWSGFYDGLTATVGDPINVLFGLGVASKMSKTVAVAAPAASRAGRLATAAKAAIPIAGRRASDLPKFSRAPSVRFFHQLLGRSTDELIDLATKNGVFDDMYRVMESRGVAGLVERYPQMENLVDGAGEVLAMSKNPDHFRDVILELRHGDWLGEDSAGYLRLTQELSEAQVRRVDEVRASLRRGELSIQSLDVGFDKVNIARSGVWVEEDGVLYADELVDDGALKSVFMGQPKIKLVDSKFLNGFLKWAERIRPDALGYQRRITKDVADTAIVQTLVGQGNLLKGSADEVAVSFLSDGRSFSIRQAGDSFMAYVDGEAIGGLSVSGESVGFLPGYSGKGGLTVDGLSIPQRVMDEAVKADPDALSKLAEGTGSISKSGAEFIAREAERLGVDVPPLDINVRVLDNLVKKIISGNPRLNDRQRQVFLRFADMTGHDVISFGNQGAVVTSQGRRKMLTGADSAMFAKDPERWLDIDAEIMRLDTLQTKMRTGTRNAWVIADIPTKVTPEWKFVLKPWRKFATNNADSWWGRFRRTQAAKFLGQTPGKSVDLRNAEAGGRDLRNFLRQTGASREFITDALNEFYGAARADRYDVVADIMKRVGEHTDHPLLQYGLEQITAKGGVFSFGIGPDGGEVAMGASRSREGARSALPYMPSQLTETFELPGPEWFKMQTRYRQARTAQALGLGRGKGGLIRGLTKSTGQRREQLADAYRAKLSARGIDTTAFSQQDLMAMAYAKVTGDVNGIGKLQWMMNGMAYPFRKFHNFFTRLQLAARPITWPLRVAFLEEGIRAQFFDLPSFYRNPIRFMESFRDAALTTRASAHRLNQIQEIGNLVTRMLPPGESFSPAKLDGLTKALVGFEDFLGNQRPSGIVSLRAALASFLEAGMDDMHRLGDLQRAGYPASRAMLQRAKKLDRAKGVLEKYHLPTTFDWAGIDEISNKGFMALIADQIGGGAHILEYRQGAMTAEQLRHYGSAWGTQVIRHIEDPIVGKYGLGRLAARAKGSSAGKYNGTALVHEPTWTKMQPLVRRIGEERGWFDDGLRLSGTLQPDDLTEVSADAFHARISEAVKVEKNGRLVGETVYVYSPEEYADMRTFLSPDGMTGFAVKEDGDLVSVFNVGGGGNGEAAVERGIREGATKLDAFDESGFLPDKYAKFGFRETARDAWDPQYAPPNWKGGTPDVVYMQLDPAIRDTDGWTDIRLAERYLEEIVDPMTSHILRPILGDDPVEAGHIADAMRTSKTITLPNNRSVTLTGANHGEAQSMLRQFVIESDMQGLPFPPQVAGMMDSKMFFDDSGNVITQGWQKITSKILEYSGERVTQTLNRRPAWLSIYKDQYEYFTNVLKLPDDVATSMARMKASELVNYVFYNLDNGSPFLKSMNRVIPFFGAMWEVAQTWAYKIPMAGNTIVGPAMMVRKVDRAYDALRSLGLIEFEQLVDDEGNVQDATMYLTFDEDPHTGTPLGDTISKAGHTMLGLPRTFVTQLANLRNAFSENDVDFDPEGGFKDSIRFQVGHPLAIAGEQAHGIMAVNQLYLGMDPAKSYLLNKVRTHIGLAADTKLADAQEGDTLSDVIARTEADPGEFIRANGVYLRDLIGKDRYAQLLRGRLTPEDIELSGSEYFEVPGSSFMDEMLDNMLFPFGVEDTVAGSLYDVLPSWSGFFFRGWGLWGSSGDAAKWAELDADGRVQLPDDELGLLEILNPPSTRMQIVGEINKQLLHLEASEGLVTRWQQEATKLERMTAAAEEAGLQVVGDGDLAEISNAGVSPELAEEWQEQRQLVTELNAKILKRAIDNAGAALIFRGVAGAMSPGNPRLVFEEEQLVDEYWDAMGLAAGDIRGSANWNLPPTLESFEIRQALVRKFIEDESGDSAKEWFKSKYPELAVFTQGTTYWEPGGKPPEMDSIDAYFEAVQQGLRQPLAPNVLMQKLARADISVEREVAVRSEFGDDPWEAAAGIVNDWTAYRAILDEARVKYASLDWWDELHDDGAYEDWRMRNREDTLTLAEELTKRFDKITETIDYLEEFAPSQDMTDKQRREYVNALKGAASGFRDFIGDWRDEIEGTFFDSPREKALNWYFDTVQAPYYEKLAELYDSLDTTLDSEDRSRIYEDIRLFQTGEFTRRYYGEGGVEFPNALQFSWDKKSETEQQERILRWMGLKPQWLGLDATTRLIEQSPGMQRYLPSTPQDFELYREYNNTVSMLADLKEPDPATGERTITDSEYNKAKKELDSRFRQALANEGRLGEIEYLDMWPIERLALAGMLPTSLEKFASYATGARQELARIEKGPTSQAGDKIFDQIYLEMLRDMETQPSLADDIMSLGSLMFDKHTIDSVFSALMYGGTFGEV